MGSKVRLELNRYQMQFVLRGDGKKELKGGKRKEDSERANRKTQQGMDRMKKVQ